MSRNLFWKRARRVLFIAICLMILLVWSSIWTDLRTYEKNSAADVLNDFCSSLSGASESGSCAKLLSDSGYKNRFVSSEISGALFAKLTDNAVLSWKPYSEEALLADAELSAAPDDSAAMPEETPADDSSSGDSYVDTSGKPSIEMQADDNAEYPDGDYLITANGVPVAKVTVGICGHYGYLNLEKRGIISVEGCRTYSIAVSSPENLYLYNSSVPLLKISPTQTGYIYPELISIHQVDPQVTVPEYWVYRFSGLFGVPEVYREGESDPIPFTKIGDTYLMDLDIDIDLSDDFEATLTDVEKSIAYLRSGDMNWDVVKGNILVNAPIYGKLASEEGMYSSKHTSQDFSEMKFEGPYVWSQNLISYNVSFEYSLMSAEGTDVYPVKHTIYFFKNPSDLRWEVCEIAEKSDE